MKNKKGFTLVELLAVIVILAVILVIAVPQIMGVIESAKSSSLEATAKLIAKGAERVYTEKEVLGETVSTLDCDEVAKINDTDYSSCDIKFVGKKAIVNIVGSGKFEGKYINNGTKELANVTDYAGTNLATTVLINSNNMTPDETGDTNLRYSGANPNNYVFFNCSDYNNQTTDTCETWRIIGIFNVSNGTVTEPRIKIIRNALPTSYSWDSSPTGKNEGYGYNVWETISGKHKNDGTDKADLNILLNEYYYKRENIDYTCYKGRYSETEAAQVTCNFKDLGLRDGTTKDLIGDAIWNIGGGNYSTNSVPYPLPTLGEYNAERGTSAYWSSIAQTSWKGKVALPYASDYGYASADLDCRDDLRAGLTHNGTSYNYTNAKCKINNWMYGGYYWTLSPRSGLNSYVFYERSEGCASDGNASSALAIRPTIYLKANVKITGENTGTSLLPYKLSL